MAIRNIVREGDEILRKKSRDVTVFDQKLHQLLGDMADTLHQADGVGLAAPQVGVLRKVVVIDLGDELIELINPVITEQEGEEYDIEGCLSSPGEWGMVTRPHRVKVKALNRFGEEFETEGEGLLARAFCHEIDHLQGVLFKDLAKEMVDPKDLK